MRKVIGKKEGARLAIAVDKDNRTLIAIANCSLSIYRCSMASIELMLNTILARSLVTVPRYSLL